MKQSELMIDEMQNIKGNVLYSPTAFLMALLITKLFVTLFALFIYAKFSPFPDAERYLKASLSSWNMSLLLNRTLFTDFIYAVLKRLFILNTLVHLFISTFLAFILWYVIKPEYKYINKPLLIVCLVLPHFLIWTGIVGKEALAIAGFLLVIQSCVDLVVWNKIKLMPFFIGLFLGLVERPHYAIVYIYLFFISCLVSQNKIKLMSLFSFRNSVILLLLVIGYVVGFLYYLQPWVINNLLSLMFKAQSYFLNFTESKTNRWDIVWHQSSDFFSNLYWGMPASIIGPTYSEVLSRPIMAPVFMEGLISLALLIILCVLLIRNIKLYSNYSTIIIWGFIPALLMGLLLNYPFGIFNVGSAIRYKQSLAPLLYFYPLLMMAALRRKKASSMPT